MTYMTKVPTNDALAEEVHKFYTMDAWREFYYVSREKIMHREPWWETE